jgi:hypothetical protein
MRKDPAMDRAIKILVGGSAIGFGGGLLAFLLLMPIIGPVSADRPGNFGPHGA